MNPQIYPIDRTDAQCDILEPLSNSSGGHARTTFDGSTTPYSTAEEVGDPFDGLSQKARARLGRGNIPLPSGYGA
jgi:hypothetical protein